MPVGNIFLNHFQSKIPILNAVYKQLKYAVPPQACRQYQPDQTVPSHTRLQMKYLVGKKSETEFTANVLKKDPKHARD